MRGNRGPPSDWQWPTARPLQQNYQQHQPNFLSFNTAWTASERSLVAADVKVIPNYINSQEQVDLLSDAFSALNATQYIYREADYVTPSFRQILKTTWSDRSWEVIVQILQFLRPLISQIFPVIHVLYMSRTSSILPHRVCQRCPGSIFVGINIFGDSVMRMTYFHNPRKYLDVFLPEKSVYVINARAKQLLYRQILPWDVSFFKGHEVYRRERIAILIGDEGFYHDNLDEVIEREMKEYVPVELKKLIQQDFWKWT